MSGKQLLWVFIVVFVLSPGGHGDSIPRGMKVVPSTVSVDLGSWLPLSWTRHEVRKDDTWESLARERYDDLTLAAALREANPDIAGADLSPGQVVELPPDATLKGETPDESWCFYWMNVARSREDVPLPVDSLAKVRVPYYGARLLAVPGKRQKKFLRLAAEEDGLLKDSDFPATAVLSFRRLVKVASPVDSIHTVIRVVEVSEGPQPILRVQTEQRYFDDEGRPLSDINPHWFSPLRISLIALVVIVWLAWRRRRARTV